MSLKSGAILLLLALCLSHVLAAVTTVRPYKFGFTIDEQQHRAEQRDERGIVMGEFGFITADGIYHVTVYATDEEGKFHIVSMKSYPYAGPIAPKTVATVAASTTTRAPPPPPAPAALPNYNFNTEACSGCFLKKSPAAGSPKTEIRTLSKPLPALATGQQDTPTQTGLSGAGGLSATGNAAPTKIGGSPAVVGISGGSFPKGNAGNGGATGGASAGSFPQGNAGNSGVSGAPLGGPSGGSFPKGVGGNGGLAGAPLGGASGGRSPSLGGVSGGAGGRPAGSAAGGASLPTGSFPAGGSGAAGSVYRGSGPSGSASGEASGDLYKFKYILDYNGHEEAGSRNGDKEGNYFAIGEDAVRRTVEYIANEFGFQPHISWQKLDEKSVLPAENSLKHYEFKWFKAAQ